MGELLWLLVQGAIFVLFTIMMLILLASWTWSAVSYQFKGKERRLKAEQEAARIEYLKRESAEWEAKQKRIHGYE